MERAAVFEVAQQVLVIRVVLAAAVGGGRAVQHEPLGVHREHLGFHVQVRGGHVGSVVSWMTSIPGADSRPTDRDAACRPLLAAREHVRCRTPGQPNPPSRNRPQATPAAFRKKSCRVPAPPPRSCFLSWHALPSPSRVFSFTSLPLAFREDLPPLVRAGYNSQKWEYNRQTLAESVATEAEITSRFRRELAVSWGSRGFARGVGGDFAGKRPYVTTLLASVVAEDVAWRGDVWF